jgi:hypothetical protein
MAGRDPDVRRLAVLVSESRRDALRRTRHRDLRPDEDALADRLAGKSFGSKSVVRNGTAAYGSAPERSSIRRSACWTKIRAIGFTGHQPLSVSIE